MEKSKHKHKYQQFLSKKGENSYTIVSVCCECGKRRDDTLKYGFIKHRDGYYKLLITKEDFYQAYGQLPIL